MKGRVGLRLAFGLASLCITFFGLAAGQVQQGQKQNIPSPGEDAERASQYIIYQHGLTKPYLGSNMRIQNWQFSGDTVVTKSMVRLTPDLASKQGHLWNTVPCHAKDWLAEFEFKVWGDSHRLNGDGFAFWYTKEHGVAGSAFGSTPQFTGLGVFFDTYSNRQGEQARKYPYVSAMVNDGTKRYDHNKDGVDTEITEGCFSNFRDKMFPTRARVSYVNRVLTVDLDFRGFKSWQLCFTANNVDLPTGAHFGFSAVTGALHDNHEISSLQVKSVDPTRVKLQPGATQQQADANKAVPPPERIVVDRSAPGSSSVVGQIFWTLFYIGLVVAVIAAVVYVIRIKMREKNMKRF